MKYGILSVWFKKVIGLQTGTKNVTTKTKSPFNQNNHQFKNLPSNLHNARSPLTYKTDRFDEKPFVVSRFPLPSPALTRSLQDGPVRSAR
jgi:hypothetical protein